MAGFWVVAGDDIWSEKTKKKRRVWVLFFRVVGRPEVACGRWEEGDGGDGEREVAGSGEEKRGGPAAQFTGGQGRRGREDRWWPERRLVELLVVIVHGWRKERRGTAWGRGRRRPEEVRSQVVEARKKVAGVNGGWWPETRGKGEEKVSVCVVVICVLACVQPP
ncbi:hypothetical protein HAX54_051775 [Datura stramonium]|uniref:Uncharacterized protein n=1 Tax=Datura stramonium TaxID=4076 RepID=A0ABS8WRT4_DATST|nr:hypothetical protein [Datura stramonium]